MSEYFLTCPFCGENDFDKIGLKTHLIADCLAYSETPTNNRIFQDSLLFEAIRSIANPPNQSTAYPPEPQPKVKGE